MRDLRDEGFVGDRLADARPYGAEASHPDREDYSLSTEATAMQAIPSPRPIQPIPSLRRRLDADPGRGGLGEEPLHLRPQRAEARLLADDGRVDVLDPAAHHPDDRPQQVDRVGVAPALVVVGEQGADVAEAAGPEQGVDHGVGEDVGVGVALEPELVLDLDPAEDQRAARAEAVAVVADPDPAHPMPRASLAPEPELAIRGSSRRTRARRRRSPPPRGPRGTRSPSRTRSRPARADGRRRRGRRGRRPRRTSRRRRATGRARRRACAGRRSRARPRPRSRRSPRPPARR